MNWVNATFDYAYTGVMAPWQSIHSLAAEQNLPEVDALATVVKVAGSIVLLIRLVRFRM